MHAKVQWSRKGAPAKGGQQKHIAYFCACKLKIKSAYVGTKNHGEGQRTG